MTTFEKIAIPLCLISYTVGIAIVQLKLGYPEVFRVSFYFYLVVASFFSLCIYYLFRTKLSVNTIGITLLALLPIQLLIKLMHWPVVLTFNIVLLLAYLFIGLLLIRSAVLRWTHLKLYAIYPLVGAVILITQFVISWPWFPWDLGQLWGYLNYVFLFIFLVMVSQKLFKSGGERRMLTLVALQATLFVIGNIFHLLVGNP